MIVQPVQPRLASAIMLLRDRPLPGQGQAQPVPYTEWGIEVFMVRRVIESDFMPDVYVFPGGSVSQDDAFAELVEGVCRHAEPSVVDPEGHTAPGSGVRAAAI